MAAYLVTHSLLSSWLHLIRENPYEDLTTEGDPLAEFMLVLRREPTPRTEAMQNGIDFENLVTAIVNGHDDPNNPWSWAAGQIAAIVNGGQLQFKARRKIQVRGMDVVLYGRLDALKAGTIYDIKFSKGYERGKFYSSTQHPTYMQHLTRSGNTVPTVAAGMRPTAGCPRRWAPRLNLRILECSMWTSAARWSASCEKKGTSYGRFERPDHRYPG